MNNELLKIFILRSNTQTGVTNFYILNIKEHTLTTNLAFLRFQTSCLISEQREFNETLFSSQVLFFKKARRDSNMSINNKTILLTQNKLEYFH